MSSLFRGLKIQFCDKTERTELGEIRHLGFKINQTKLLVDVLGRYSKGDQRNTVLGKTVAKKVLPQQAKYYLVAHCENY